jgi:hypothetical protein
MKTWNEKYMKRQIEEVITESYLLCLSEREVRLYLKCFLDSCETVLSKSASDQRNLKIAGIRIAMLKAYLLLSADSRPVPHPVKKGGAHSSELSSEHLRFVEQVVGARSLIVRLLNEYDSSFTRAVCEDCERKNQRGRSRSARSIAILILLVCAGLGLVSAAIVFVLRVIK